MINKVILLGRLGQDPEVKHLDNDRTVANFSLATSEKYKTKSGEKKEDTDWHNIVIWGGQAKVAEKYLRKGDQIYLEGKVRTRSWEDKEGNKRYTTEILCDKFQMLGNQQNGGANGAKDGGAKAAANQVAEAHEADLPFG